MKISRINTKDYSIIIGKNSISTLSSEVKNHCPKCKKIAIIIDKKIPKKFLIKIKNNLKKYKIHIFVVKFKVYLHINNKQNSNL